MEKMIIIDPTNITNKKNKFTDLLIANPATKGYESPKPKEITYKLEKVLGYSCPNKVLLTINDQNVCFVNSKNGAKSMIDYAYTLDDKALEDGKIKKRIREILGVE